MPTFIAYYKTDAGTDRQTIHARDREHARAIARLDDRFGHWFRAVRLYDDESRR